MHFHKKTHTHLCPGGVLAIKKWPVLLPGAFQPLKVACFAPWGVSAIKKGLTRLPCKSVCECVCVAPGRPGHGKTRGFRPPAQNPRISRFPGRPRPSYFTVSGAPGGPESSYFTVSGAPGGPEPLYFTVSGAPGPPKPSYFTMSGAPGSPESSYFSVFVSGFAQFLMAEAGGRGGDPTRAKKC